MDQKSLKMFVDLANNLHFGKTAEANHVSTSTLSRAIQRIETEVGCNLLHRDNRTVVLTQAGQQFQQYAQQQLDNWHVLQLSLRQEQTQLQGKLNIFCSVTAAYSHLPPLLDQFRQQHPLVEIMLVTGDAADAFEQLSSQSVDLAIAVKPESLSRQFYFHPLAQVPLTVIAPSKVCHVQQQVNMPVIEWGNIPMILPEHGIARKRFDYWFRRRQQGKPNIYATVSGHEALVSMVALGCGVGMVPQVVVDNSPVKDRVKNLENIGDIPPFELGVCCLNQHKANSLITAFLQSIE
ncbi:MULTISPECIES: HTH-type transcriptional activator IlvY [Thalassotalea]|uniref:HTH-type transcriptional activator IlvY n=1 Tax=Thalassotalea TaxID=1518149 RepID=UPI0009439B8B|nr:MULTISPECIES: HTH-type transcriptional activator IlvY [Thalassotalea]OKY27055.1 transcriptional regulator IlvY [Thalassotalea sp. PP2-459]